MHNLRRAFFLYIFIWSLIEISVDGSPLQLSNSKRDKITKSTESSVKNTDVESNETETQDETDGGAASSVSVESGTAGNGEKGEEEEEEADDAIPHMLSVDPKSDFTTHPNFDLLPDLSDCGRSWKGYKSEKNSTRQKRIVGGKLVPLGKYPFMGRLELHEGGSGNMSERCGGSLINSKYVLTAAHCVSRIPSGHSLSSIAFGTVDVRKTKQCVHTNDTDCTDKRRYDVEEIIIHDDYITGSLLNDIALIRLTEPVKFDAFTSPICLPRNEKLLRKWKNDKLTVAGFGRTNGDDDNATHYPSLLHEVELPLMPREDCETYYKRKTGKLDGSRFCAGGEYEKGDCRGDSGGPLFKKLSIDELEGKERFVQFGLVSYGHCALEGVPGGYINILYYLPWILDNMEP